MVEAVDEGHEDVSELGSALLTLSGLLPVRVEDDEREHGEDREPPALGGLRCEESREGCPGGERAGQ